MHLSEEVRRLAGEMNVSLSEIARRTDQSPANLSKKLNKDTLSFEDFERILEALGVKLECNFIFPGQDKTPAAGLDKRTENRIAILEKELELERLKSDYYKSSEFSFRTAMETISGGIDILDRHSGEPDKVRSCIDRMRIATGQLMDIMEGPGGDQVEKQDALSHPVAADPIGMKRILVVDDNAINRDIVVELLADSGIEAEEACDGMEAVSRLKAMPAGYYDLVLMDLNMPGMDGFEATRTIRELADDRRDTVIVAMTAGDSAEAREKAASAGINGFALKPLNMKKLLEIFRTDTAI